MYSIDKAVYWGCKIQVLSRNEEITQFYESGKLYQTDDTDTHIIAPVSLSYMKFYTP